MKTVKHLMLLACALAMFSCDLIESADPINEARELTGDQNTDLILTDIFDGPGADYYVTSTWRLNARVTVMPGVNIRMESEATIYVDVDGSFSAVGTASDPINIFGNQNSKGYWNEINFDDSNNSLNQLHFVNISDAGGGYESGAVTLSGTAQVQITNTTIDNCLEYGLFLVNEESKLTGFSNNTLSNCGKYPVGLNTNHMHFMDATNTFANNGDNNFIHVESGSSVTQHVTWKNLTVPYYLTSFYNIIESDVNVEPGTIFLMGSESRISIWADGSLRMIGTPDQRITVSGKVNSPGYFEGIYFEDSNNPLNVFLYVDVAYAGPGSNGANIWLSGSTRFEISNSSVNHSANYGVYVSRYAVFTNGENNVFTGNAGIDIFVQD